MTRRMMSICTLVVTGLFAFPLTSRAEGPKFKEGEWETTIKVKMAGMPMQIPGFSTTSCLTKKNSVPDTSKEGSECTRKKLKRKGKTVSWEISCTTKDGGKVTGKGSITFKNAKAYEGQMDMSFDQGGRAMQMKYDMTGAYKGPCKKKQ